MAERSGNTDNDSEESLFDSISHWLEGVDPAAARSLLEDLECLELDEPLAATLPTAGTVIGRYRIVRHIASGGMGAVFAAEQTEPVKRDVALKVILRHSSTQPFARFRTEQQSLARLEHRNIARLYDAGLDEKGRPFFVMELVLGENIALYCDLRTLTVRQRLELFLDACAAVHYAHQRGILHRDLKPSNVLVAENNGMPELRVIDFGLSLAASGDANDSRTTFADIVGTPEFMSPEQWVADEHGVDTRSDLYALGVMLYHLLSGALPWEPRDLERYFPEQIKLRQLGRIAPPSDRFRRLPNREVVAADRKSTARTLERTLQGDLDAIVLKALAGDRDARYSSVLEFARDLERYLHDFPVLAAPANFRSIAVKFVRRHRAATTGAILVGLSLVGGLITSTTYWLRAERAREDAVTSEQEAIRVRDYLKNILSASFRDEYATVDPKLTEIIGREEPTLAARFAAFPYSEFEIRSMFGGSYLKVGNTKEALRQYDLALECIARAIQQNPSQRTAAIEESRLTTVLARMYALLDLGDAGEVLATAEREFSRLQPIDDGPRVRLMLNTARAKDLLEDPDGAERSLEQAFEISAAMVSRNPNPNARDLYQWVAEDYARTFLDHGKPRRALQLLDNLPVPIDPQQVRRSAKLSILLGTATLRCGQLDRAAGLLEPMLERISSSYPDHHSLVQLALRAVAELYATRNATGDSERKATVESRIVPS